MFDPSGTSPLAEAMRWITDTLFGTVAVSLCVIAVAVLGLMMLTGRLPVRRGLEVVLGCFALLGAPARCTGTSVPPEEVAAPSRWAGLG